MESQTLDVASYRCRLATFGVGSWSSLRFCSPTDCARHGWESKGRDVLRCATCGAELNYHNGLKLGNATSHAKQWLQQGHKVECIWSKEGFECSEEFAKVDTSLVSAKAIKEQHALLCDVLLEPIPMEESFLLSSTEGQSVTSVMTLLELPFTPHSHACLLILLAGWELSLQEKTLSCQWCQHTIPMQIAQLPSQSRLEIPVGFHPLQDHRFFCPFVVQHHYELCKSGVDITSSSAEVPQVTGFQAMLYSLSKVDDRQDVDLLLISLLLQQKRNHTHRSAPVCPFLPNVPEWACHWVRLTPELGGKVQPRNSLAHGPVRARVAVALFSQPNPPQNLAQLHERAVQFAQEEHRRQMKEEVDTLAASMAAEGRVLPATVWRWPTVTERIPKLGEKQMRRMLLHVTNKYNKEQVCQMTAMDLVRAYTNDIVPIVFKVRQKLVEMNGQLPRGLPVGEEVTPAPPPSPPPMADFSSETPAPKRRKHTETPPASSCKGTHTPKQNPQPVCPTPHVPEKCTPQLSTKPAEEPCEHPLASFIRIPQDVSKHTTVIRLDGSGRGNNSVRFPPLPPLKGNSLGRDPRGGGTQFAQQRRTRGFW